MTQQHKFQLEDVAGRATGLSASGPALEKRWQILAEFLSLYFSVIKESRDTKPYVGIYTYSSM
jgi:hypothetical protein